MVKQFEQRLVSLGVSRNTIKAYLSDLRVAERTGVITMDLKKVDMQKLAQMNRSASTKHRIRAGIRRYANYLVAEQGLPEVPKVIESTAMPKIKRTLPRITNSQTAKVIINKMKNIEIKLALSILAITGCRISSLVGIRIEDFNGEELTFTVSKGGKPYLAFVNQQVLDSLKEHVENRTTGFVFRTRKEAQCSEDNLRLKIKKAMGNDYRNPHSFRHGLITELVSRGADLTAVKELVNHSSVVTTERYVHLSPKFVRAKLNGSHPFLDN